MSNDFEVQLANEWDGQRVPANGVIQGKVDGLRCLFVIANGRYCAYSRNGTRLNNVGHIAAQLKQFNGWVLDGEIVGQGKDGWSSAMTAVMSDENGDSSAVFLVFDLLTGKEFDSRHCDRPLHERRKVLEKKLKKSCNVGLIPSFKVKTPADVKKKMKEFVAAGLEGAMLKDLDAPYVFKRSSAWLKVKPVKTADLKIVGVEPGKGRLKGTLGAVKVRGPKGIVSGVGTGFSDDERARLWAMGKKLIGKIAEVEYFGDSSNGALRFPRWKRLRSDR